MPDIKETMNAKSAAESLAAQQGAAKSAAEQAQAAKDQLKTLADQNKIHIDTSEAAKNSEGSLKELVGLVQTLINKVNEQSQTISQMSAAQQAANMAKPGAGGGDEKERTVQFKTVGLLLKQIVKAKLKEMVANTKMGKFFGKMGKLLKKKDKKDTKTIDAKAAKKGGGKGGEVPPPTLDNKMIASSMASAAANALNPIALVTAFFTKLLPILLVLGILLYGFITGFLDGDVSDFISVMIGVIIGAVLAYIAYMLIKELIVLGIKVVCEFMKVAIEAAADWATVPIIIGIIAVIGIAFLLAAALIIIIIGLALVGIVLAVWLITGVITDMIEDMTEDIMEIMGEQFEKLGGMINAVIETFVVLVPYMANMMQKMADDLKTGIQNALIKLIITFSFMSVVMQRLADEISRIFNGIAAAIIASALGQMIQKQEEQAAEITISQLTADFESSALMCMLIAAAVAEQVGEKFGEAMISFMDLIEDIFGDIGDIIYDHIDTMMSTINAMLDTYLELFKTSITQLSTLFVTAMTAIISITAAFLTLLFTMPILGLLFGLIGTNSFSAAIEPLLEQTKQIKALLKQLVLGNTQRQTGIIRSAAVNNSQVNGTEQFNTNNYSQNTIQPVDGESTFESADEITTERVILDTNREMMEFLKEQFERIVNSLDSIGEEMGAEMDKGGWF